MTPVLELVNLHKTFKNDLFKPKQKAVAGVSFKFRAGTCTGLLGHNGAGKTTSIRIILGLIKQDQGQVLFKGHPMQVKDRQYIGYMPEINKLPTALTPYEILKFQLKLFGSSDLSSKSMKERIATSLEQVGLTKHQKKRVSRMSKGMGRRLAWAQATIHNPELVILDEPFSGLDPIGRQEMHSWISDLRAKGTSILLCTHEISNTHTLCDDFFILKQGQLVYSFEKDKNAADAAIPMYISVSGAKISDLEQTQSSQKLPPWTNATTSGFLTKLHFQNQTDANTWLSHLVKNGFVVTSFAEDHKVFDDKILAYFKGASL
jgi:ABC-2 type transport system ATP-binding protein